MLDYLLTRSLSPAQVAILAVVTGALFAFLGIGLLLSGFASASNGELTDLGVGLAFAGVVLVGAGVYALVRRDRARGPPE